MKTQKPSKRTANNAFQRGGKLDSSSEKQPKKAIPPPPPHKRGRRLVTLAHVKAGIAHTIRQLELEAIDANRGNAMINGYRVFGALLGAGDGKDLTVVIQRETAPAEGVQGLAGALQRETEHYLGSQHDNSMTGESVVESSAAALPNALAPRTATQATRPDAQPQPEAPRASAALYGLPGGGAKA